MGGAVAFGAFVLGASIVESRAEQLERVGDLVDGTVTDVSTGRGFSSESITVEFDHDGRRRRETIYLDDSSPTYRTGEVVTVVVDPTNVERVTVQGETNQTPITVWPMIFALVGGVGAMVSGAVALARARRQRQLLSRSPWRQVAIEYLEVREYRSIRPLLLVSNGDEEHVLTLVSTLRWQLSRTGLRTAASVQIVGDPSRYVVIRAPGFSVLCSARRPSTRRARRRWRDEFNNAVVPPPVAPGSLPHD